MHGDWYQLKNSDAVASPALLVDPERVRENLGRMIKQSGNVSRLRPHVKTHKMRELVEMQIGAGILKFKCATIAEAEMTAAAGAREVLLAYQPVGPTIGRLLTLMRKFPRTQYAVIADDAGVLRSLSENARRDGATVEVLIDIDNGMHRSGIAPDARARELYQLLATLPALRAGGLHVYDGHIHDTDVVARTLKCEEAWKPVDQLRRDLVTAGLPVETVVAGGTPTFPIHAERPDVELSPGTCLLWDHGYATKLPDLPYQAAAALLTRVVSKPAAERLCLDLGHKAVASENPHPRVFFPELPDAVAIGHSEEHLVLETPAATSLGVGAELYGIPWHVCPTVALHSQATVVQSGEARGTWEVTARDRMLSI